MKLVIGLGNPGHQYDFTRHNYGFLALDFYAKLHNLNWVVKHRFDAAYLKTSALALGLEPKANQTVIFIKPQKFYNNSGVAAGDFAHFYKVPRSNILVLCDDFNIPFNTTRFREKGSDGGNKGLRSVAKELGTSDFPRLRIGTGNDELRKRMGDKDFVLSKFTPEELELLPKALKAISARLDDFIR